MKKYNKLLLTSTILTCTALSDAQAQLRTSVDDGAGQQQRCGGATTCYTGTNVVAGGISVSGPSYTLPNTSPEIIIDSDSALNHGQGITENPNNVFISVEHNVTNTTINGYGLEITAFGDTEASGTAASVISVANGISLHSLHVASGRTHLASGPSTDGIVLGTGASIANAISIAGGLRAIGGGNAVDFSAADTGVTLSIDSRATLAGNLVLGEGDTIIFDDATGGTQNFTYNDDIIGDTGGGTETVRVNAANDAVIFGGHLLNVNTLDVAAGTARFTGTSGNGSKQTTFSDGITIGNDGTLELQGGAEITADVTGSAGTNTITISDGLLTGDIAFAAGTNNLNINGGAFTGTYTAASGSDTVALQGTGTLTNATLTNTDGVNAYLDINTDFNVVDSTIIDGFGIAVGNNSTFTVTSDSALGSNTNLGRIGIQAGSTLKGTGTIRNTGSSLVNFGTYAPGNSVGTQAITGDFEQKSTGTLEIEFDNTGIDLVDISGTATLDGEVDLIELASGVTLNSPQVFLEADGGVTGTFSTTTKTFLNDTILTDATIGYDANSAFVTFAGFSSVDNNDDTDSTDTSKNGGGKVTTAIDNATASTALTNIINALRAGSDVDDALDSQGNIVTNTAVNQANGALGQVISTVRAQIGGSTATVSNTGVSAGNGFSNPFGRQTAWAQVVGASSKTDTSASARGSESTAHGIAFGAEAPIENSDTILGVFAGYTQSNTDIHGLNDKSEVNNYQIGLYGAHDFNDSPLKLNGTLSASYLDFETRRQTTQGTAIGAFDGWGAYADAELAYELETKSGYQISPFIGLQASVIDRDGYTESGAGVLNNSVQGETAEHLSTVLGFEYSADDKIMDNVRIMPKVRIGWAHQYLDTSSQTTASFANAQNAVFKTEGPERNADSARLGLDLEFSSVEKSDWSAFVRYNGDIASNAQDHMIRIGAGLKF